MYKINRTSVLNQMHDHSFAVFFSGVAPQKSADQTYPFEVNRNFYYLTGINQENVVLLLLKGEGHTQEILFLEPIDPVQALWVGEGLTKEKATELSGIQSILDRNQFEVMISRYLTDSRAAIFGELKYMYVDLERRDINQLPTLSNQFAGKMQKQYPQLVISNIHLVLSKLRSIKHDVEIKHMQEAIEITKDAILSLMTNAKPGMKEYQLEAYYNFHLNYHGVKPSFTTIAASGKNATVLHYEKNNDTLKDGDLILFDLGVYKDFYCSDISRTFPVNGKFTPRQREIYEIVLEANKKSIEILRPGLTNKEFNDFGKQCLIDGLKRIGKIQSDEEISKYYYHSLGHFLGIDVHDVGDYSVPFEEGQVVTVEPGLYIADENIGIRIEDNILITKNGPVNLSKSIIKEVDEIEAFMKNRD